MSYLLRQNFIKRVLKNFILKSSKLKEFTDKNFKDENCRKLSEWIENTVKEEKLLVTSNFSFSHSVFKRLILQTCKNQGLFGKVLTFFRTSLIIFYHNSQRMSDSFLNITESSELN